MNPVEEYDSLVATMASNRSQIEKLAARLEKAKLYSADPEVVEDITGRLLTVQMVYGLNANSLQLIYEEAINYHAMVTEGKAIERELGVAGVAVNSTKGRL